MFRPEPPDEMPIEPLRENVFTNNTYKLHSVLHHVVRKVPLVALPRAIHDTVESSGDPEQSHCMFLLPLC